MKKTIPTLILSMLFCCFAATAFAAPGDLDSAWGNGGIVTASYNYNNRAIDLHVQPGGKIIAVGSARANMNGTASGFAVTRFNSDGSPDATFGSGGKVVTRIGENEISYAEAVALRPNGRIVVAGITQRVYNNEPTDLAIVSYLGDALLPKPTQFDFGGYGKADQAVFRPSNGVWYLQQSQAGLRNVAFGQSGDKIVPADYDGDNRTDIAVYRSGT